MSGNEQLNVDITAKDDASKVIDPLQKKVDALEKSDPTIDVDANTKSATEDVDSFAKKLTKLSSSDQVVLLALRAADAQQELAKIATQLATIDADDPTIDVKVAQYEQTANELDQLKTKITAIGDADPDAAGHLANTKDRIDDLGKSADSSKSVLANMVGNSVQDVGALGGVAGSAGVAIGQMAEYMADARAEGDSFKEILSGFGAVAGPIAALALAVQAFGDVMSARGKAVKETADDVKLMTKAMEEGGDEAGNYAKALQSAGEVSARFGKQTADDVGGIVSVLDKIPGGGKLVVDLASSFGLFGEKTQDLTPLLAKAGIAVDQWSAAVKGGQPAADSFAAALAQTTLSAGEQRNVVEALGNAQTDWATATKNAAAVNAVLGTSADTATTALDGQGRSLAALNAEGGRYQGMADQYQAETQQSIDKLKGLTKATDDYTAGYEALSDAVNHDQSMINLRNQLDDVRQAGDDAYAAQAAADKARATGAKDAAEKAAAAETAMRTFQTAVNDAKTDIINLGNTAGANPVDVKADIDKIDQGDLDAVAADAEAYYRRNPIDAATRLKLISTIVAGVGQPVTITGTSAGLGDTINVTQVLPRGYHGDALADASRSARRSGGMYRRARR